MRVQVVLVVAAAACLAGGCTSSPSSPSGVSPTGPLTPPPNSVEAVSGISRQPITGARVTVNGQSYITDATGSVQPSGAPAGNSDVEIEAPGYLPRESRVALGAHTVMTLWPVANDDEASAVRRMAFNQYAAFPDVLFPLGEDGFFVTMPDASPELRAAWAAAANRFGAPLGIVYTVGTQFQYEDGEVEVRFGDTSSNRGCAPSPVTGFCRDAGAYAIFSVAEDRATDSVTINRVLASLFLGPDNFTGLLNPNAPTETLSAFETQTIKMILQHRNKTHWPDDDRP